MVFVSRIPPHSIVFVNFLNVRILIVFDSKNCLEFDRLFKSWRYISCTFDTNGKLVQENLECPGDLVYTEEYGECVDYNKAFECKLFKVFFQITSRCGHHVLSRCRREPPRFARQTEPQLSRTSLRYADRASAMQ